MTAFTLPANPPGIRGLGDPELERLRDMHPDLPSRTDCVTCTGTGTFRWYQEHDDGTDGEPVDYTCDCDGQFLLHRYLLYSGVGKHAQRLRWADASGLTTDVEEVALDYADNIDAYAASGVGLLLWGKFGTGKTLLSTLLLKTLLAKGTRGYFTTFHRMLDLFTDGWATDDAKRWFDRRVRNTGVLVIDDIGREYAGRNAVAETAIDHVLRHRIESAKPTVITTNRTPEELGVQYSGQALSMLSECMIMHEFRGEDFRRQQNVRLIRESRDRVVRPITVG